MQVIEKGGKAKGTKLLVKNVPFEATKKELKELFGCVLAAAWSMTLSRCVGVHHAFFVQDVWATEVSEDPT